MAGGWYRLVLESRNGSSTTLAKRWVQIGQSSHEPERRNPPPEERLVRRVAQATGGVFDAPDRAFLPPTERVPTTVPLRGWLLPLVVLLVLADVVLRGRTML